MHALVTLLTRRRAVFAVALALYAAWMIARPLMQERVSGDFASMHVAAKRLAADERVYFPQLRAEDEMPNKHGLIFLDLLRPLTPMSPPLAQALWMAFSFSFLGHALFLLARMLSAGSGAAILAFALMAPFAHLLAKYAQSGFFLLWLLTLGIYCCYRLRWLAAGAFFGVATAVKLFPIVLLPWALYTGRWRVAVGFVIGVAASMAFPIALHGPDRVESHLRDYVAMLEQDTAASSHHPFHQSLRPLVLASIAPSYDVGIASDEDRREAARYDGVRNFAYDPRIWEHKEAVVAVASALFAILCAVAIPPFFARRRRNAGAEAARAMTEDRTAIVGEVGLVLAVMVLVSPLAWKHYYVWCLPMLAWLVDRAAAASRSARVALVGFVCLLTLPHKGVLGTRMAETYAVYHGYAAGLAVFCVLAAIALCCWRPSGASSLREELREEQREEQAQ